MSVVLIVEDEMLEQDFLKSMVEEIEPESTIIVCGDGAEAVKLAAKHRPHFIFMDIMLPELDGISAIEEIRKFLPKAIISILTAYSDFSYAQKAISLGIFEYMLKPVKPSVFKEVFMKMIETRNDNITNLKDNEKIDEASNKERQSFIEEALAFIHENFRERLTLNTVASKVYINPKYFSHVFKKEMGVSFTEYVTSLKIEHACNLLATTDYHAYRISIECGFSDPSYFNRVFCSQMNMTPQTYRKQINPKE
ncbi:MAG: response regulator transcription factor [Anaerovoracaceae bacterium]